MDVPLISVYTRHNDDCGRKGDRFWKQCKCKKWLEYFHNGKQYRLSAKTRIWTVAEEVKRVKEDQFKRGDVGAASAPVVTAAAKGRTTIADEVRAFIQGKETENIGASTIRKLRHQLNLFEQFMTQRSKFYPSAITKQDVQEFRSSWVWGDLTKIKAQQNLRGFIRFCCKENRIDLLDALKTIKETKEGKLRRKPKPFTDAELNTLLNTVPKLFPDPLEASRLTALIRLTVSTGLAIIDAVQLERAALAKAAKTGVLEIERQKTTRPATIPISDALLEELSAVLNGNPKYVFWHGESLADSETKRLQGEMRELMMAADLYIKGNVFHRFRDSAVDTWVGLGWSMTEIATALGDTVAIVDKHYRDWASQRTKERMAKLPVREWARSAQV